MQTKKVKIGEIRQDADSARTHNKRNIVAIAESLRKFGQQKPIVVAPNGTIVAGNAMYLAARRLGWKEISVVTTHLEGKAASAYSLADNRTVELSAWNEKVLARTAAGVARTRTPLCSPPTGFSDDDLSKMIENEANAAKPEDIVADVADAVTKSGDIVRLGNHRLICGDCTDQDVIAGLFQGEKASLVWTDPPYGVALQIFKRQSMIESSMMRKPETRLQTNC